MNPIRAVILLLTIVGATCASSAAVFASDHDDGEIALKGRNLNLTDVFVFREEEQDSTATAGQNLIIGVCLNPRSLARVQYYYSTTARYDIHVSRRALVTDAVVGDDDFVFRFCFGAPNPTTRQQDITIDTIVGSTSTTVTQDDLAATIRTRAMTLTTAGEPATVPAANIQNYTTQGSTFTVFAGPREDPFFFDVEQFFRTRAALAMQGPNPPPTGFPFRATTDAVDFAAGYNVLAIVLRVPIAFLQQGTTDTVFDVWATISVPQ